MIIDEKIKEYISSIKRDRGSQLETADFDEILAIWEMSESVEAFKENIIRAGIDRLDAISRKHGVKKPVAGPRA